MQGLHHFRQRSAKIPIILISGYATFQLAQEALRLGATDYLTKPFEPKELDKIVRSILAKARPQGDSRLDSIDSNAGFKLHLPLQNLQENSFLSSRHRSYFLAFAQNALSNKKRTFEAISIHELIKTMTLQFDAIHREETVACEITPSNRKLQINCDMYLLGGALANLVWACMLETKGDKSPLTLSFDCSGGKLRVLYKQSNTRLPGAILARFKHWHQHPDSDLDANTAMLILTENVVRLHRGQFILNTSSDLDRLLEISLPLTQSPRP